MWPTTPLVDLHMEGVKHQAGWHQLFSSTSANQSKLHLCLLVKWPSLTCLHGELLCPQVICASC